MNWLNWNNFELGMAGLPDLVTRWDDAALELLGAPDWMIAAARANNTHLAPGVYASQVAEGGETDAPALDELREQGRTDEAAALAQLGARLAVQHGALGEAATATVDEVMRGAGEAGATLGRWLPWLVGGAAVVIGGTFAAVSAARLVPRRAPR